MKPLKIAVLTEIVNYHSGSRAPLEIARHLSMLGQDVTIYAYSTMLDKKALSNLKKDGVKISLFDRANIPFLGKYISSISLYKTLAKDRPDIATFSGTPPFFFAAKLSGAPVVRIYQGTQFDALLERKTPNEKLTVFDTFINKIANIYIYLVDFTSFRLSKGIVAISKYSKDEGEALYKRKVDKVIYHGTSKLVKKWPKLKKNNAINIICVSRITPYKGFHLIISALKKVKTRKEFSLTIAGSQPKANYVRYLKKIGGKRLKIVIDPTDKELSALYQQSDIYVCADRYLYFGLPICEAAHWGIPTVTLDLAAAKEIVEHNKTGYVAKNQEELAMYLQLLIENTKTLKRLGVAAKKRAEAVFTWENAAKEYLVLFRKIV